jgi:hypothetical protein
MPGSAGLHRAGEPNLPGQTVAGADHADAVIVDPGRLPKLLVVA